MCNDKIKVSIVLMMGGIHYVELFFNCMKPSPLLFMNVELYNNVNISMLLHVRLFTDKKWPQATFNKNIPP